MSIKHYILILLIICASCASETNNRSNYAENEAPNNAMESSAKSSSKISKNSESKKESITFDKDNRNSSLKEKSANKSNQEYSEEYEVETEIDEIIDYSEDSEFIPTTNTNFSVTQLKAYNEKAVLLFNEFIEYQQLILNKNADEQLKKQAVKMSKNIFDEKGQITIKNQAPISIKKYLKQALNNSITPFNKEGAFQFQKQISNTSKAGSFEVKNQKTAEVYLINYALISKTKRFGKKVKSIDQIVLTNIEILE